MAGLPSCLSLLPRDSPAASCNLSEASFMLPVAEFISAAGHCQFPGGFLVALLITANIFPLAVWSRSWMTVQRQAATLAVINLAPLWTGLTFGFPADILGIDRPTLVWSHRWFGRMVAFHSLLHGSIIIATAHNPAESMRRSYVPLLVSRLCQSLPKREPGWSISQRCTIPNIV